MTQNEVRCICARRSLLARYGTSRSGEPYLHIKVHKQNRIYADIYIDGDATCRLTCRDCLRVHKIKIVTSGHRSDLIRQVVDEATYGARRARVASIPNPR